MKKGRLFARRDEQSLAPLVELSDHLLTSDSRIIGVDHLEVPLDEFGVPRSADFVKMALGSVADGYYWTGYFDIHHMAWPRTNYGASAEPGEQSLAVKYRECESLKLRVPRQLHNYFHKATLPPPIPDTDIMRQYVEEQRQVNRLYYAASLRYIAVHGVDEHTKEQWRKKIYLAKLEGMKDGELGLLPDREYLSNLEPSEARVALKSIARIQGLASIRGEYQSLHKEAA